MASACSSGAASSPPTPSASPSGWYTDADLPGVHAAELSRAGYTLSAPTRTPIFYEVKAEGVAYRDYPGHHILWSVITDVKADLPAPYGFSCTCYVMSLTPPGLDETPYYPGGLPPPSPSPSPVRVLAPTYLLEFVDAETGQWKGRFFGHG